MTPKICLSTRIYFCAHLEYTLRIYTLLLMSLSLNVLVLPTKTRNFIFCFVLRCTVIYARLTKAEQPQEETNPFFTGHQFDLVHYLYFMVWSVVTNSLESEHLNFVLYLLVPKSVHRYVQGKLKAGRCKCIWYLEMPCCSGPYMLWCVGNRIQFDKLGLIPNNF